MYTTLVRGLKGLRAPSPRRASSNTSPAQAGKSRPSSSLDLSQLENRTLFSATPIVLDAISVDSVEDAPNTEIDLAEIFSLDDSGSVEYSVVENSQPGIIESATIDGDGLLTLDYAADAHGEASVTLQVVNSLGVTEQVSVNVDLESVNDAPTAINLQLVTVTDADEGRTVIDLFAAFDDIEDADEDLTYEILSNTNESLFSSVSFDLDQGLLILDHAADAFGTAELTLQATDTGRLSVGAGTADDFHVYDVIRGDDGVERPSDASDIGLSEIHLWTHWFFFEYTENGYDYSELDSEKLAGALERLAVNGDPSIPIVFDIETYGFDNTPDGRDAFAEAFHLANELAAEFEIGLYRFMPERRWFQPTNYQTALNHVDLNIQSGFTQRLESVTESYEQWRLENSYYRTENVTEQYGGTPLSEMVDSINASLYTFYRNDSDTEPIWRRADFDAATDTFTVDGPSFDTVEVVRIKRTVDGQFRNGMKEWTDYYVVNADGNSFQLAATPGGEVLDFTDEYTGEVIVAAKTYDHIWHDPSVVLWETYANENIAEAKLFEGKPIYSWISPSFRGAGEVHMDGDFFRWQLELLRSQVDSIVIFEEKDYDAEYHENQGWWTALKDFMATLDIPEATTTINVSSAVEADPNFAPLASSDTVETVEGQPLDILAGRLLANDFDLEGDPLTVTIESGPEFGSLELITTGQWRYVPNEGFNGTDQFSYRVYDGTSYSEVTTVEVNVIGENDRPVANDDSYITVEDQALSISAKSLMSDDYDPEGNDLLFRLGTGAEHGSVSMNADGSIYYRPDLNFNGDDFFTYFVSDGVEEAEARVNIAVLPENDRPIAVADRFEVLQGQAIEIRTEDLLANDVDAESDEITVTVTRQPQNGSLIFDPDVGYVYVPFDGFAGKDQFFYRVNDGELDSMETVVEIEVVPTNTAPVARGETFTVAEDQPLVLSADSLLANDADAEGDELSLELVASPTRGNVRWTRSGDLVYVPPADFSGTDQFEYIVSDGEHRSDVVSVEIRVTATNDAPVAADESYRVGRGQILNVEGDGVLANDRDADGSSLKVKLARDVRNGRLSLAADGSFTYTPNRGFSGVDRFSYSVVDEFGASSLATASITVESLFGLSGDLQLLGGTPFTLGGSIVGAFSPITSLPLNGEEDDE